MTRGMPRWIAMLLALLVCACAPPPSAVALSPPAARQSAAEPIRAMTFNIRLDIASDGANAWPNRKAMVAALIQHQAPDLLGMQEVLLGQKRDLEAALPGYGMVGVGRDDGEEAGEFSPLAFRRDRFELLESGTFWLSETPGRPGKGWDAAYPRIATWAILSDRRTGMRLRVLNTHFDHVGELARANSAAQIAQWVESGPGAGSPTVVMGDFNAMPDSEPYRRLANGAASGLVDTRGASRAPPYGPPGTFTGFDITSNAAAPIDHIFVSSGFAVDSYAVITQHWGGRLPSDHYPVLAVLRPVQP